MFMVLKVMLPGYPGKSELNTQGLENLSLSHEIEQRDQQYRVQTKALVPRVGHYSQGF